MLQATSAEQGAGVSELQLTAVRTGAVPCPGDGPTPPCRRATQFPAKKKKVVGGRVVREAHNVPGRCAEMFVVRWPAAGAASEGNCAWGTSLAHAEWLRP